MATPSKAKKDLWTELTFDSPKDPSGREIATKIPRGKPSLKVRKAKREELEKQGMTRKEAESWIAKESDRIRRRADGSRAVMQEMGSVTKKRKNPVIMEDIEDAAMRVGLRDAEAGPKLIEENRQKVIKSHYGRYAKGGSVKAKKGRRGDGICQRGRTKGRMV